MPKLELLGTIPFRDLEKTFRNATFRGLYDKKGNVRAPYTNASFSLVKVHPPKSLGGMPEVRGKGHRAPLFTPQPTIYENQTNIMKEVDRFLLSHGKKLSNLREAVEYSWQDRGEFHILPPIIEKHSYKLKDGFIDLDHMRTRFKDAYVKDARGNLHHLGATHLKNFYIDEVSKVPHYDIFNSNAPIINYGLGLDGMFDFYIICDGSHRLDYILERVKQPMTALLVEAKSPRTPLYPYYAFPVPFRPTIRLSSKKSERMYHKLERDKIHLLNDFICKVLHYNWEDAGLKVSKLRSNVEIY